MQRMSHNYGNTVLYQLYEQQNTSFNLFDDLVANEQMKRVYEAQLNMVTMIRNISTNQL